MGTLITKKYSLMAAASMGVVLLLLATLLTQLTAQNYNANAAANEGNPEISRLLQDAKAKAAELSRDADDMEALTRSSASWESHAAMLERIKEHVNDLGRIAERLTALRNNAAPWQQTAIDRMLPLMRELASNTTAAINHLKEHQTMPTMGSYPEYLRANSETAHQLSDIISSFAEYGATKARLDQLEQRLEIASR